MESPLSKLMLMKMQKQVKQLESHACQLSNSTEMVPRLMNSKEQVKNNLYRRMLLLK